MILSLDCHGEWERIGLGLWPYMSVILNRHHTLDIFRAKRNLRKAPGTGCLSCGTLLRITSSTHRVCVFVNLSTCANTWNLSR